MANGFVQKISDTGYSTILRTSDHRVDTPIHLDGTTIRYAAPEIFVRRASDNFSLPKTQAHKIEIYSYALLLYTVALSGEDIFGVLANAQYQLGKIQERTQDEVVHEYEWPSEIRKNVIHSTIESSKTNARDGRWMHNIPPVAAREEDQDFAEHLAPILEAMLVQDPGAKANDFSTAFDILAPGPEPTSYHLDKDMQNLSLEPQSKRSAQGPAPVFALWSITNCRSALTEVLASTREIFWFDDRPFRLGIREARFSHNFFLKPAIGLNTLRYNIFATWEAKAAALHDPN